MKIHPTFLRVVDMMVGSFGTLPQVQDWHKAGCPVVEEPRPPIPSLPSLPLIKEQKVIEVLRFYPEVREVLDAANARIKELETDLERARRCHRYENCPLCHEARNEALEEAARLFEGWT